VAATGLSKGKVFQLIASGRLRAFKIDGCTLIPRAELERLLNPRRSD
jgi:excisionase family DNA binding protein